MTLVEMIRKRENWRVATATPATAGTELKCPLPAIVPNCSTKMTYCERCGGGYWIRVTYDAPLQCGRCFPSETRVETLFFPGGALPPASQSVGNSPTTEIVIEPAPTNANLIYWETGTGRILGPAVPEFLAREGHVFWIVTTFEGQIRWINADRLRSRKTFGAQDKVQAIELARS